MSDYKCVYRSGDMPKTDHWVIITFDSTFIPGDERSRTNPGHGYPEHTEYHVNYKAFTDEASWLAEVERKTKRNLESTYGKEEFYAMKVLMANVEVKTSVSINVK